MHALRFGRLWILSYDERAGRGGKNALGRVLEQRRLGVYLFLHLVRLSYDFLDWIQFLKYKMPMLLVISLVQWTQIWNQNLPRAEKCCTSNHSCFEIPFKNFVLITDENQSKWNRGMRKSKKSRWSIAERIPDPLWNHWEMCSTRQCRERIVPPRDLLLLLLNAPLPLPAPWDVCYCRSTKIKGPLGRWSKNLWSNFKLKASRREELNEIQRHHFLPRQIQTIEWTVHVQQILSSPSKTTHENAPKTSW